MSIPIMDKMADDELFVTWFEHIAELNSVNMVKLYRYFFGMSYKNDKRFHSKYPRELERVCQIGAHDWIGSPAEVLLRHTPFTLDRAILTRGRQAQLVETVLRTSEPIGVMSSADMGYNGTGLNMCPVCMWEDMQKYGRHVIHVQHQRGRACWKHGVRLMGYRYYHDDADDGMMNDIESVKATAGEIHAAGIWHEVYENISGNITAEMVHAAFREYMIEHEGLSVKTVCEKTDISLNRLWGSVSGRVCIPERLAEWFFEQEDFHLDFGYENDGPDIDADDGAENDGSKTDPVLHVCCPVCGHQYWTHRESLRLGIGCPVCRKSMTTNDVMDRIIENYDDGCWHFVDGTDYKQMEHAEKGVIIAQDLVGFWNRTRPDRQKGGVIEYERQKKNAVGKTMTIRDGSVMTITAYRGHRDIDVMIGDEIYRGFAYRRFLNGVAPDEYFRKHRSVLRNNKCLPVMSWRVGETAVNKGGYKMTIVAYRRNNDVDVEFEDGTVARHRCYRNFKKGSIKKPVE